MCVFIPCPNLNIIWHNFRFLHTFPLILWKRDVFCYFYSNESFFHFLLVDVTLNICFSCKPQKETTFFLWRFYVLIDKREITYTTNCLFACLTIRIHALMSNNDLDLLTRIITWTINRRNAIGHTPKIAKSINLDIDPVSLIFTCL